MSLKEKPPELRFLSLYTTATRNPKITAKLLPATVPDMRTIPLMLNMVFAITVAADVLPGVKPLEGLAAGAIAAKILKELGITLTAYTKSIGDIAISTLNLAEITNNVLYMPDADAAAKASAYLDTCMQEHDSSGGVIECIIDGMPAGIGEPVFDKLDADLAKAIFSIGAVKGFEIGDGFLTSFAKGSENNDAFFYDENGNVCKKTNHAGGILGGMSDGAPIVLRAAVKPTPSIFKAQQTVNRSGENITLEIKGRHDPVIVPRAVVVVESMAALVLVDALMENMSSRLEHMIEFYNS